MDKWSTAFTAIGGLAAVGGLIDLALYKSEKEKLKARLEDWWLQFTDVKWSNFGRAEAELAIQILDRWAGPRLWSWKRWRFAALSTLGIYVLVVFWILLRAAWNAGNLDFQKEWSSLDIQAFGIVSSLVAAAIVAFALSLSVTRLIATWAARLCRGALFNGLTFALLLIIHLILFLFWSRFVYVLEMLPLITVGVVNDEMKLFSFSDQTMKELELAFDPGELSALLPGWSKLFSLRNSEVGSGTIILAFKAAMDIVANGLRIVFALVFLSSFVFRPLVQEPLSRLWYGAMNSGKPIFTMLFGAVGTMIAVTQILT